MNLGRTKKAPVLSEMDRIVVKNQDIVNVFARTVSDLKDVNMDMQVLRERKEAEILMLQTEAEVLKSQAEINNKVVDKIMDFLS